jgi:hypothetical protein
MGWEMRDLGVFPITARLDSHGGEKEQEHERLAEELSERLREMTLAVISDPRYAEILLFEPDYYGEAPEKWRQVVTLLAIAQRVIGGEEFGGYVDVSSALEGVEEVLDYARWKAFEQAGPADPEPGSRRIVGGKALTFTEYWGVRP